MLQGKNAIVTGSRRGIGRATVECFARYGANIWACARKEDKAFEQDMAVLAEKHGVWIKPVYFDLAEEEEIKAGVKSILAEKLPVDILVNNAGVAHSGMLLTTPLSKVKEVFETNFFSHLLLIQHIAKYMLRRRSGNIVNIASVGGLEHNMGYIAYGASKAAIIWVTRACAKELAQHGIRVNGIAPGLVDTEMGHYRTEDELEKVLGRTPMKRMAQPEEVAETVAFLVSEKASYITGEILCVDGGRL